MKSTPVPLKNISPKKCYKKRNNVNFHGYFVTDNGIKQVFREAIEIYREHTGLSFEEAFDDYSGAIHPLVVYGLNDG